MKKTRNHESGRSMIEIVGVLAITGLLTAGAFVLINSGMASQKRNRAADEINALVTGVRSLAVEAEDFSNLPSVRASDDTNSEGAKLARLILKTDGTTPFGSDSFYVIGKSSADGDGLYVYIIGFDNVSDCEAMALRSYAGNSKLLCHATSAPYYLKMLYKK